MGTAIGYKTIMGVVGQSAFQTVRAASNANPTDKVLLRSESLSHQMVDHLQDALVGYAGYTGRHRAFEPVAGSIEVDVPYTQKDGSNSDFVSADLLIAAAMGNADWVAGSGSNQITMVDDLAAFLTIAWDKDVNATYPWEAIGCMVNSMTLSCNAGEPLRGTFEILGNDLVYPADTPTTTVANLAALCDDAYNLVMFDDFEFRIDDHGGVLAAANKTQISNFTVTVNNNLTPAQQSTVANTGHTAVLTPIQYVRNGFREVTFEFTMPRYDADTLLAFWANDTALQADILSTGPSSEEFDIIFPNLKIRNISAPISGPEAVEVTVTCDCFRWVSTSDMTFSDSGAVSSSTAEFNSEVWIETDNDRTAVISLVGDGT